MSETTSTDHANTSELLKVSIQFNLIPAHLLQGVSSRLSIKNINSIIFVVNLLRKLVVSFRKEGS